MTAPVELVAYDAAWPQRFEAEAAALTEMLRPWLAGAIEHVGSTAVPGLTAKPVIDIMAPVRGLTESRAAIAAVAVLDYHYAPYRADVMHWFCKPSPESRTHHLHLVPLGSALWRERLAFRDALRADADTAAAYADLKARLAAAHPRDREAYTAGKSTFISDVLSRAPRPGTARRH